MELARNFSSPAASSSPVERESGPFTFLEFFAGGGMARAGLGTKWRCLFANDADPRKCAAYERNWGAGSILRGDVARLATADIPGPADLAWASFPCQDLSLAGTGAGLSGARSGTFWPFWTLIRALNAESRGPRIVVLENVVGALTSHGGRDFAAIAGALAKEGFRFGALVIDARLFLPQSRPRLFVIALSRGANAPANLVGDSLAAPRALRAAVEGLDRRTRSLWTWWRLPEPPRRNLFLSDIIEDKPENVEWHSKAETARLVSLMSTAHRARLDRARRSGAREVGAVYRRTRVDALGGKVQRAEIRFDGVAGCLRTSRGGSSRQTILIVEGRKTRSRLLSPREAARLMGLAEDYALPARYNEAYDLVGDGVAVPVVRHLAETLLEPLLISQ
jgi:DNA (cytosine-5)-methyltransferase 1